jgi:helix-turn-helix protein
VSLEQIRRAFATQCKGPGQKLLLIVLADFADDAGEHIYPSQGTLADRCQLDDRTVRRFLADLLESGHIALVKSAIGRVPATYKLRLERAIRPGATPTAGETSTHFASVDRQNHAVARAPRPTTPQNPSEPEEKSAGTRASPTGVLPAQANGNGPDWNPSMSLPTHAPSLAKPVTLSESERLLEIERRRRVATELAASAASTAQK